MLKLLVPIDGSESSNHAIDHLLKRKAAYQDGVEVHLLNVQHPLPSLVASHVPQGNLDKHHEEEGLACLKTAMQKLDAAGVRFTHHIVVGDAAETIARFAKEKGCDEILMGTRGHGGATGLLMGSVATKVMHLTGVPVTFVK